MLDLDKSDDVLHGPDGQILLLLTDRYPVLNVYYKSVVEMVRMHQVLQEVVVEINAVDLNQKSIQFCFEKCLEILNNKLDSHLLKKNYLRKREVEFECFGVPIKTEYASVMEEFSYRFGMKLREVYHEQLTSLPGMQLLTSLPDGKAQGNQDQRIDY